MGLELYNMYIFYDLLYPYEKPQNGGGLLGVTSSSSSSRSS